MARYLVMLAGTVAGLGLAASVLSATPPGSPLSEADFMQAPAAQPDREVAALSPEDRAARMKQHLERWLEVPRPDLSSNAQALQREAIDFVTPEMYSRAPTETEQAADVLAGAAVGLRTGRRARRHTDATRSSAAANRPLVG